MNLIVAKDQNNGIGRNNGLLVSLKKDMQYFKEKTMGKVVVMGMNTYNSLPTKFRPLPNRLNIVISRNRGVDEDGVIVVKSVDELFKVLGERHIDESDVFCIGGASIYKLLLPYCDRLYITNIMKKFDDADVFFPELNMIEWKLVSSTKAEENGITFFFEVLAKK